MKILKVPAYYCTDQKPTAGLFVKDQAIALARSGHQPGILYPDDSIYNLRSLFSKNSKIRLAKEEDIIVVRSKPFALPKRNIQLLKFWARDYQHLFEVYRHHYGLPDLLHAHTWWGAYAAWQLAQKYDLPFVLTEHSSDFLRADPFSAWKDAVIREVFDQAAAIIAVSQALQKKMQAFTKQPIKVIPNVVDTDFFSLRTSHSSNPGKEAPIQLLAIGDLVPVKRFDLLLHSVNHMVSGHLTVHLKIIGNGPELKHLQQLTRSLNLDRQVAFIKETSREQLLGYYHQADLLISTSEHETFGLVIAEALACGLPVVSTNSGGPKDLVNAQNGMLVDCNHPADLAKAIKETWKKTEEFKPQLMRQQIIDYCGEASFVHKLTKVYQQVLS